MKRYLLISMLFASCYTKTKKPDQDFMNKVKQQAGLDSSLQTRIQIIPRKYFFGKKSNSERIAGFFYIKNIGNVNFNALSIKSNCECIVTKYSTNTIIPNDSLKVDYEIDVNDQTGFISNSIIAIGNCQAGNQTFYIEGTIIK